MTLREVAEEFVGGCHIVSRWPVSGEVAATKTSATESRQKVRVAA